jgi:hypothetical protein
MGRFGDQRYHAKLSASLATFDCGLLDAHVAVAGVEERISQSLRLVI